MTACREAGQLLRARLDGQATQTHVAAEQWVRPRCEGLAGELLGARPVCHAAQAHVAETPR